MIRCDRFAGCRSSETFMRLNAGRFESVGDVCAVAVCSLTAGALPVPACTWRSVFRSITSRPEGLSVPALRKSSIVGVCELSACSNPKPSAVACSWRRNSCASRGRSIGFFRSVCRTTRSSAAGMDATISRGGRGSSETCLSAMANGVSPLKGATPVSIS